MLEIINEGIKISIKTDRPKEYLENLRDALFGVLKRQSMNSSEMNPDPEGLNVYILDLLHNMDERIEMSVKSETNDTVFDTKSD